MSNHPSSSPAIKTVALSKSFGKKQALDGLSLTIESPSITGLLGRNGAGKTTLLKLCAGLMSKSSGNLEIWGQVPLNNLNVLAQLIYSHSDLSYSGGLKLKTIVSDHQLMYPNFDQAFAMGLLDYFSLDLDKKYTSLSRGGQSTFNFVCALAARTPLTMLDEPSLGMDVTVRKAAFEILLREQSEHPRVFIVASHLISEIENLLDSVLIIDEGKLILHDSIENIRERAYFLEGERAALEAFTTDKNVIFRNDAELRSSVVVLEPITEQLANVAQSTGLSVGALRPEELYIYLTRENKEGELECLW